MRREIASLLLEFNPVDTEKENSFYKEWDEKIKIIEQEMSEIRDWKIKNILQYWRYNDFIPTDLYYYLRRNYPVSIPRVLFFPFYYIEPKYEEIKRRAGDLADKWLKDIFSRESFYKRNKEYFTRIEAKYFLSCDWEPACINFGWLMDHFLNTKIKANDLNLSLNIFEPFRDCDAYKIVIEYFKFLCSNKKYIKEDEIRGINYFLKDEYISAGKNIDFKNHTYHSLKRLSDEWHISNTIKDRFEHRYDHKIVQDYILFIYKNMRRARDRKNEIGDICDFLNARILNEQDFNFENMTWHELKRLSDEWHAELQRRRDESFRKKIEEKLNAKWIKSSIKNFSYEKDGKTWTIKEITTGKSLYEEGNEMRHCVFSYLPDCVQGYKHIFSASCKSGDDDDEEKIATVEISRDKRLAQARGKSNARIDNETAEIIKIWADENQINCDDYFNRHRFYGQVA